MQNWEYRYFSGDLPGDGNKYNDGTQKFENVNTMSHLNELGKEGWEVISVTKTQANNGFSSRHSFLFKRSIF